MLTAQVRRARRQHCSTAAPHRPTCASAQQGTGLSVTRTYTHTHTQLQHLEQCHVSTHARCLPRTDEAG
jgi:hypothetical protein